ncbi:MAG: cobalamin biosynthesis protein CobW [Clostridia bacterium]|nr:cobalamin biosynthesis protein CobW [Clostridia bacterium]
MTRIDIISGFLGAGKTTLINRLIKEGFEGEKIVLIENEFGEIGVDGGFLQDAGIQIAEMNSGCICCSLVGDFSKALKQVVEEYAPDRILIEPSGVGKLSDVTKAVISAEIDGAVLNSSVVVVDVNKCKMYMKNFGEFFNDQISHAGCIFFSHTDKTTENKLSEALSLVRAHNEEAMIVTTPSGKLDIKTMIDAMENKVSMEDELKALMDEDDTCPVCGHHHHDHDEHHHHHHHNNDHHDHCCEHDHDEHHHHHDHCCEHDHDEHEYHHHHDRCCEHDHDEHEYHHHHDHCCEHDHDHHHHHHADEVFTSWGTETVRKYTVDKINTILSALGDSEKYGMILRAKGFVEGFDGEWIYFDYIPEEPNVRTGAPAAIGKFCVIGAHINEAALAELFGAKE